MTLGIQLMASTKFNLRNQLDNDMFNHISYVTNRILMLLKKEGVEKENLVTMGKYLWRLLRVLQAYNHKRRDVTLARIVNIALDFKSVFGGE